MSSSVRVVRRLSKNYQSREVAIELDILEGWTVDETFALAQAMVNALSGRRIYNRGAVNGLLREYYDDDSVDIGDYEEQAEEI